MEELQNILKKDNFKIKALRFAEYAHRNQVRKNDKNIPYIIHPLKVASILKKYDSNNELIAAAYLHDVVEDTEFTLEDIEKYFGHRVKILVKNNTELDKSLSWEERKEETIERLKNVDHESKMLAAADRIANLLDLKEYFEKIGYQDFSKFKRGLEKQEWYFRNVYLSIIENEDPKFPLYIKLKNCINDVFERTMEDYFKTEKKLIKRVN